MFDGNSSIYSPQPLPIGNEDEANISVGHYIYICDIYVLYICMYVNMYYC